MARRPGSRGPLSNAVHVKLSPAQHEALTAAAFVHGCSPPEVLRKALDEHLAGRPELRSVVETVRRARRASITPRRAAARS